MRTDSPQSRKMSDSDQHHQLLLQNDWRAGVLVSNHFLDDVIGLIGIQEYLGCFSADEIPVKRCMSLPCFSMIVNLSNTDEPGTHFVSIIAHNGIVIYCDSLALPEDIFYHKLRDELFAPIKAKIILRSSNRIQDLSSGYCGFYALYSIILFSSLPSCPHEFAPKMLGDVRLMIMDQSKLEPMDDERLIPFTDDNLRQNDLYVVSNICLLLKQIEK